MFIIRWIYAFSDYLSEVIDDILHNNWFVDIFLFVFWKDNMLIVSLKHLWWFTGVR